MSYHNSFIRLCWHMLTITLFFIFLLCLSPTAHATSNMSESNQQCMQCHGNPDFAVEEEGKTKSLFVESLAFETSVHTFMECASCHPGADVFPHDETVKIDRTKITETCSTCHANQTEEYSNSFHANGAATCTDCHEIHSIQKQANIPIGQRLQSEVETCTKCHQGRISESYQESFHGKAVSLGGTKVPSCVSCHGAHDILGPNDPASPVAIANIPQTCATCHKEPQANMAAGTEHFLLEREGPGKPMFYTYKFFTWLTIITITLLIIHIELELFRRYRDSKQ